MAEQKKNASYDNCMNQLHTRYNSRGVVANAEKERRSLDKKESASAPNAYFIAKMNRGSVSDTYKNGEFNGQKYMTTNDFLKYYNNHKETVPASVQIRRPAPVTKEFARPKTEVAAKANVDTQSPSYVRVRNDDERRSRPIKKIDPKADTIVMPAKKSSNNIKDRVKRLFNKWFPADSKNEKKTEAKKNIPVAAIGLLISLSVAMTLIVSTSVMAQNSAKELDNTRYEISQLKKQEALLNEELTKREDLDAIEDYASKKLGMIKREYVASSYIELGEGNSVNGQAENNGKELAAILSAMFGN